MIDDLLVSVDERDRREKKLVAALGSGLGYGRVMQLCEQLWREALIEIGMPNGGGEHTVGPCAAEMESCQCVTAANPELDHNGHCDWCCGVQRVTKHVRMVQRRTRDEHV